MSNECKWLLSNVEQNLYNAECGYVHSFSNGNPGDNGFIYCPNCGKKIVITLTEEQEFQMLLSNYGEDGIRIYNRAIDDFAKAIGPITSGFRKALKTNPAAFIDIGLIQERLKK